MADFTNFFGSVSNTQTNNTFSLADYASIRNGSYGKLLKAYYAKQDSEANDAAIEAENKELAILKNEADDLKSSMLDVMDEELYEKKKVKDKDGNETEEYDWDAIVKAMKSYVDNYNTLVDKTAESDDTAVLRNGVWMTKATSVNSGLLSEVGITIGEDNKLSLDEDALKEANMSTLKNLFTGHSSYADDVLRNASKISTAAVSAASKNAATYNGSGELDKIISSGLLYDGEM